MDYTPRKSVANLGQIESPYEKKRLQVLSNMLSERNYLKVVLSKNVRLIEKSHFGSFCWPVCDRFPGGVQCIAKTFHAAVSSEGEALRLCTRAGDECDGEAFEGNRGVQQDDEVRHGDGGAHLQTPAVGEVRARTEEVHGYVRRRGRTRPEARTPRRRSPIAAPFRA